MPAAHKAAAIAVRFRVVMRISFLLDFGFFRDASGITANDPALVCRSTRVAPKDCARSPRMSSQGSGQNAFYRTFGATWRHFSQTCPNLSDACDPLCNTADTADGTPVACWNNFAQVSARDALARGVLRMACRAGVRPALESITKAAHSPPYRGPAAMCGCCSHPAWKSPPSRLRHRVQGCARQSAGHTPSCFSQPLRRRRS